MTKDLIGYQEMTDRALRGVVREALKHIQKKGLLGNHHFYLTFKTHHPGAEIPDFLQERYPDEMTIVLQNQYSGLKVDDDGFEVTLSFQKFPTTLVIPFAALTGFADPSVQFGLQFQNASAQQAPAQAAKSAEPEPSLEPEAAAKPAEAAHVTPQVVSLDKFRKK